MHALITGASSGIGEAVAEVFAGAGYDITLVARRQQELERVAAKVASGGVRTRAVACDLCDLDRMSALVQQAEQELGPIDVLVNNAGMQIVAPVQEIDVEHAERLLKLNLMAPLRLSRVALRGMMERGRGTIVDVVSVASYLFPPFQSYYSASKAALAAFSVTLRSELRKKGVHVVTVYPGPVKTAMGYQALDGYAEDPMKGLPWGEADVLARRILRAVERRSATVVYPRFYWIPRLFPGLARLFMDRFGPGAR